MSARRIVAATTPLLVALLVLPAAFAAASRPGYQNVPHAGGESGFTGAGGGGGGGGGGSTGDASGLPITGMNLLVLAAFGCVLLACGILLMRATRKR